MTQEISLPWSQQQLPEYFKNRDGGVDSLGGFWRHADQLSSLATELSVACKRYNFKPWNNGEGDRKTAPLDISDLSVFGPVAYIARGLKFLSHNHPELNALGSGAITDGNLVFLHNGLIDALNQESYKAKDGSNFLLSFMVHTAEAVGRSQLGMDMRVNSPLPVLGSNAFALPKGFTCEQQLSFVSARTLYDTLKSSYSGAAGPIAIDEICDRIDKASDTTHEQRTQARVIDAVETWHRHATEAGGKTLHHIKDQREAQRIPREIKEYITQWQPILAAAETIKARPGFETYAPLSPEEIGKNAFFQGPHATYSLHACLEDFSDRNLGAADLSGIYPAIQKGISNEAIHLHLARAFTKNAKTTKEQLELGEMVGLDLVAQPWCTAQMRVWAICGAGGFSWLGRASENSDEQHYLSNVVAASLLGVKDNELAQKRVSKEDFIKAVEMGGDVICEMKDFRKYAKLAGVEEYEACFMHGSVALSLEYFKSLKESQQTDALLHCAQNRHALTLFPQLFEMTGVQADALTPNGQTVAHLLMDNTTKMHAPQLEAVLVQLLERGLDPNARDISGFFAGERSTAPTCLVDRTPLIQATSVWQHQSLQNQTQSVAAPSRRRQL